MDDARTYAIIGAAMEVHRQLGHGFLESVYQHALSIEFTARAIPFEREVALPIRYKSIELPCSYRVDFLCFAKVLVELKAAAALSNSDAAQIINYLRAGNCGTGLLLNFGAPRLGFQRFIWNGRTASSASA